MRAELKRIEREVAIRNNRGLHARASSRFVKCAESFDAGITVSRNGQSVPGTSIMGLMMLAAHNGSTIVISAEGPEAEAAIDALTKLVLNGFNDPS
ncbi:MAG: HPr family phosphocarrier protein [Hyphomicrobiales bacterium]